MDSWPLDKHRKLEESSGCLTASENTTLSDIPTVYYRVGQDETVDSVIELYVYSTDGDECP